MDQTLQKLISDFLKALKDQSDSCDSQGYADPKETRKVKYRLKKVNKKAEELGMAHHDVVTLISKANIGA